MVIKNLDGENLEKLPSKGIEILWDKEAIEVVERIVNDVKERGDEALIDNAKKFDEAPEDFSLKVSEEEFEEARKIVEEDVNLREVANNFLEMAKRVEKFHRKQLEYLNLKGKWKTRTTGKVGQVIVPIEKVCVYVPGGRAIYPSTLIMNTIPAKVAGVKEIFVSTPSKKGKVSPVILYLCKALGVNGVFKIGGAAAVASFAFGTQTVPKADMIVGPGNKYFILAKKLLSGIIGIDMLPGPSEIAIIVDHGNPYYISLDVLSQLEHDPESSGYVISPDPLLLEEIRNNIIKTIQEAKRKEILSFSSKNLFFIEVSSIEEGFDLINKIAPEHLEVIVRGITYKNIDKFVKNAGTVLIGENTSTVLTDYIAGPNHVLPTGSTARFSSPLGVYNFVKFYNFAEWTQKDLKKDKNLVSKLARYEGLEIHAQAVEQRS